MFLHTWALIAGVAALGLPVAIHLLTKPRPRPLPLSTLKFVREAVTARRARQRLRDLLVLTLRTLAVLLVALAIARPQPSRQPLISDAQGGSAVRIVVLDASQSMAAVERGTTALERARTAAAAHLRYRPGLSANLIVAAARPHAVLAEPSQNFEALRDALSRIEPRPERLDVNRALALAAEMLAPQSETDRRRRELIVVSDFQRSNWARADLTSLPEETRIQLEATSAGAPPANLGLVRVEFRGRTAVGGSARLEVEIGNYSPTPRSATVEVTLGNATYRLDGTCAAERRTTLTQDIPLRETGWQVGHARLVGISDALADDDRRGLAVRVGDQPLYALITRQSPQLRPSSSHFIECGLVPDPHAGPAASARLARMGPHGLDRQVLAAADVIVLDHPGKLAADELNLLAGLLRRGQGVIYVAGEAIDATNLGQLMELAGAELRMPVDFSPLAAAPSHRERVVTAVRSGGPPFDVFGDHVAAVVETLRFAGGLNTRPREDALQEDLWATYDDGTACLVHASCGTGSLVVLNADLNRSNLPRTAAFVPLLDQLVQQVLERKQTGHHAICGEPLLLRLPGGVEGAESLRIVGPDDSHTTASLGQLWDEGGGVIWNWPAPDRPGVYRVMRGHETIWAVPIHVPDEESPLDALSAEVLEHRLAAGHAVQYRGAGSGVDQRDVMWTWLLTAGVLCLLGELGALVAFRS